ncbi:MULTISPECIES: 7-carboxy-7-deazaguanine synthase QueE [Aeribacillus]|jgi:7-carboxy-7-deazaguanine synthase|uniref:7-carboxy-7-deazaguanine synthase n=1 Tax=Aeribacillus pallidus TaxID=33936 RepID=A0A165WD92_9BACI|nr:MULTISPECIES: 7-carboxy-7-deazaguanine synthase QueE [Aeribacillus]KZN94896.1 7-cyano-7-deazaguanosine (preQ0) biosynthesis protein QueE [Aeribacillus pallidus]MDR9794697.1 7-carboxy-7-deazaguanine synthase QueE [Aeribacillus pallidus]MED0702605.1 7-carboxy-7-deazaguanine synthase QueE [Aeribacillus composti]MED0717092.1 7-carboxy-7-deazaguanine synthase QueE [Aeribacillus composti]MED0744369.1 7-carboxy-7-deazaguanine synthase QueE [Aeribacillus composti]
MKKIPVIEIFGPTIQGEGMVIGQKTMFVRTAGCDYSCSWCDSAFTWNGSAKDEIKQMTAAEILDDLIELGGDRFNHVTISGGNPALIRGLDELIILLREQGFRTALETQGSRYQDWFLLIDDLTLSPKPPSSGMKTNFTVLDDIMKRLIDGGRKDNVSLKVVVFNEEDFDYAKNVHLRYPNISFYLQPGNDQVNEQNDHLLRNQLLEKLEWLIELTVLSKEMNDARVLPQLHALVWGNKRGV